MIEATDAHNLDRTLDVAADALRLPPWDADVTTLSGGERRRVALCRLLLSKPDMLLLDEPTNHLDAESVAWLERFLHDYPGTVVAVTHDRYFLDNVAGWILELDRGHGIPWEGNYSSWLEQKEQRLEHGGEAGSRPHQGDEGGAGVGARQPQGPPGQEQGPPGALRGTAVAGIPEAQRDQRDLYSAGAASGRPGDRSDQELRKAFGDRLLFDDLNFKLPKGSIVGIIGPNGAGKTTLFRMLIGHEQPDGGSLRSAKPCRLAYVDQTRDDLDGSKTVWQEISTGWI